MKIFLIFGAVLNAISLVGLSLYAAIAIPTFSMWFYRWQYSVNNTYQLVQMEEEDLHKVTRHLIRYLQGREAELQIETIVDGQARNFFSDIEIRHMEDVREMFRIGHILTFTALGIFILSLILFAIWGRKKFKVLFKAWQGAAIVILLLMLAAGIWLAIDWFGIFYWFHEVFFHNDYWILNPQTDLLINIVPYEFFITITIFISATFLAFIVKMFTLATLFRWRMRRAERLKSKN